MKNAKNIACGGLVKSHHQKYYISPDFLYKYFFKYITFFPIGRSRATFQAPAGTADFVLNKFGSVASLRVLDSIYLHAVCRGIQHSLTNGSSPHLDIVGTRRTP